MAELPEDCYDQKINVSNLKDHIRNIITQGKNHEYLQVDVSPSDGGFGGHEEPPEIIVITDIHPDNLEGRFREMEEKLGYYLDEVDDYSDNSYSEWNYRLHLEFTD